MFGPKASAFKTSAVHKMPVNSKEYLSLDAKDVPEDEKFFYE